jgi:hypothetical protein
MSHRGVWVLWFSFSSVHVLKNDAVIISQAKNANIRVEGTCCFFWGTVPVYLTLYFQTPVIT